MCILLMQINYDCFLASNISSILNIYNNGENMKKIASIFMSFLLLGFIVTPAHADLGIQVDDPWVRTAPPNAPALGAFVKIYNHTNQDVKLLSAHADGYKDVQLHRTVEADGMMKMVEQAFMPIPAQGSLHLKPGSWHVMLINPDTVPKKGDTVMITLTFDNNTSQVVGFKVRKGKMMMHHKMH